MIITTIAKILGEGIPLFGNIKVEKNFMIEKVEIINKSFPVFRTIESAL